MNIDFYIAFLSIFCAFFWVMSFYYISLMFCCFKHKGNCNKCHRWCCPRVKYIEDDGEEKK